MHSCHALHWLVTCRWHLADLINKITIIFFFSLSDLPEFSVYTFCRRGFELCLFCFCVHLETQTQKLKLTLRSCDSVYLHPGGKMSRSTLRLISLLLSLLLHGTGTIWLSELCRLRYGVEMMNEVSVWKRHGILIGVKAGNNAATDRYKENFTPSTWEK